MPLEALPLVQAVNRLMRRPVSDAAREETLPSAQSRPIDLGCVRTDPVSIAGGSLHVYTLVRNAIDNAVH